MWVERSNNPNDKNIRGLLETVYEGHPIKNETISIEK